MPSGTYDHNKPLTEQETKAFNRFVRKNVTHKKYKLSRQQLIYRRLAKDTLQKYQLIACERGLIHPEEVS